MLLPSSFATGESRSASRDTRYYTLYELFDSLWHKSPGDDSARSGDGRDSGLAERTGFEPAVSVSPHTLSRRAR